MPKQQRGEDTASRLLDAALKVYAAAGADGFTVQAVTAASGISLGSLYHHYGSFDGLAAALYSRCMGELLDAMNAALQSVRSPRAGIAAGVRAYLAFTAEHAAAARFIHASSYAAFLPKHAPAIVAAKAPRLRRILDWFRPHVASGAMVDLPDWLVEMLVIGPVAEVARRWLAGAPDIDLDEAARRLPERIWQSLRAPEATGPRASAAPRRTSRR